MKPALFAIALSSAAFALSASGQVGVVTAPDEHGSWIRLRIDACSDEAVERHIAPADVDQYRAALFHYLGRDYQACWRIDEGTVIADQDGTDVAVRVIDSDGDVNVLPVHAFHHEAGKR